MDYSGLSKEELIQKLESANKKVRQLKASENKLKLSEKQLLHDIARLELSFNVGDIFTWEANLEKDALIIDDNYRNSLGYSEGEIPFFLSDWLPLLEPDFLAKMRAALIAHIKGNEEFYQLEYKIKDKSGKLRTYLTQGKIIEWQNDKAVKLVGISLDLTKKKELEKNTLKRNIRIQKQHAEIVNLSTNDAIVNHGISYALQTYTETLTKVLSICRVSIWVIQDGKRDMVCLDAYDRRNDSHSNGDTLNILNYPIYFSALKNNVSLNIDDARDNPLTTEFNSDYLTNHDIYSILDSIIMIQGKIKGVVFCEACNDYRHWYKDEITFVRVVSELIGNSITNFEKDKLLSALTESESKFNEIVNSVPGIVFQFFYRNENDMGVNYISKFGTVFDIDKDVEDKFALFVQKLADEDRQDFLNSVIDASRNRDDWFYEGKYIRNDKQVIWFRIISSKMPSNNNNEVIFNGLIFDITESKLAEIEIKELNKKLEKLNENLEEKVRLRTLDLEEANFELKELNDAITQDSYRLQQLNQKLTRSEEELKKAIATKDKFFSIIAHDLRGPLSGVRNLIELLSNHHEDMNDEEFNNILHNLDNASNNTFNLLENLLQWSRSQSRTIEFNPEESSICMELDNVANMLSSIMASKNIELEKNIGQCSGAYYDKYMIRTVLRNLISNAIKFTHKGGLITLSCKEHDAHIHVSIEDNGIGIKKENIDKIFRIDKSYSTPGTANEKGTGLGLILCKEFIDKHGGEIGVNSTEGAGSEFFFTLPKIR